VLLRPARRHSAVATPSCLRVVCTGNTAAGRLKPVYKVMGDPRNIAHAKKVTQEKHHKAKHAQHAGTPQPAGKAQTEKNKPAADEQSTAPKPEAEKPAQPPDSAQLEKSLAVLSTLKDLEFHSRANIEKLAELSLTIEEELKQKAFAEAIGAVYAAQDAFQSKIVKLIEDYEAECAHLKPPG
jgi:sRNA-binding protein